MSMNASQMNSYIPEQAYRYFPKDTTPKNGVQRSIFDGNTQFTQEEHSMIDKFRLYCRDHKYNLEPLWTDNMILRFLYANNFKMSKTLTSAKEHTTWRATKPPVKVDDALQKVLNSGLLYVHGRDSQFHPIVVFNFYMLDPKKIDLDLITRALTFWFEYVIDEWMLPGQVENWVFIADVKGIGVGSVLNPSARKVFGYLQDNYKCRLYKLYIINVTPILYYPWTIIKKFLDEVTVQKVQICNGQIPTGLLDYTNPEQVEQKYGGFAPNLTKFWPPALPSNNYFVSPRDSDPIITKENYVSLYQTGRLTNMRIDKLAIEDLQLRAQSEAIITNKESSICSNELEEKDGIKYNKKFASSWPSAKKQSYEQLQMNTLLQQNEIHEEEVFETEANYADYMSEMLEYNQMGSHIREFQASFLPIASLR